jgi:outer membrane lipoprotein-sorting protein
MKRKTLLQIFLFLLLTGSFLAACQAKTTSPAVNTPTAQLDEGQMRTRIVAAFKGQYEHSHRIDSTITTSDQTILVSIEFSPPDRYSISSQDNYYSQIIIVGDAVYGLADNQWTKLPMSPDQLINPNALKEMEASLQDVQYLGQEQLGDIQADIFQFKSKTTIGDGQVEQQNKLWVGVSDGLPHKLEIDGQIAAMDARSNTVQGVKAVTMQTMTYDEGIKIEAPIN